MPHTRPVFDYDYVPPYSAEDENDIEPWFDLYQPRFVTAPGTTIDPTELFRQPDMYGSIRSYDTNQRYYDANRDVTSGTQQVRSFAVPQMLYGGPSRVA